MPGEREIRVEGLRGNLLAEFSVERVVLGDRDGEWLRLAGARLSWRPLALRRGRLELDELAIDSLEVVRAPLGEADDAPGASSGWPRLPLAVRVSALAVRDLRLGEALAGEPLEFSIEGSSHVAEGGALQTQLEVLPGSGDAGTVFLDAAYDPDGDQLVLDASVAALPAELLARASGLDVREPLDLTVRGQGRLDDWRGRLDARLGAQASLAAELILDVRDTRRLRVSARAQAKGLLDAPLAALVGERLDVELDVGFPGGERLVLHAVDVDGDTAAIAASGELRAAGPDVALRARLTPAGVAAINALTAPLSLAGLAAQGNVGGTFTEPRANLDLDGTGATLEGASARALAAHVEARLEARAAGSAGARIALHGEGSVTGVRLPGATLSALPEQTLDVSLRGRLDADLATMVIERAEVQSEPAGMHLRASGEIRDDGADVELEARARRLAAAAPLLAAPIDGRADITARLHAARGGEVLDAELSGVLEELSSGLPALDALLGSGVSLAAKVRRDGESLWRVSGVRIEAERVGVDADVAIESEKARIDGEYSVKIPDLRPLAAFLEVPLEGAVAARGRVQGAIADPALGASLDAQRLAIADRSLGAVSGGIELASLASPRGKASLALALPGAGALEARSGVALEAGERLHLRDLRITAPAGRIGGELSVPLDGRPLVGKLSGEITDLAALRDALAATDAAPELLASIDAAAGSATLEVTLTAHETGRGSSQGARGDVRARDLALVVDGRRLQVATLEGQAAFSALAPAPHGTLSVRARGAALDAARADELDIDAKLAGDAPISVAIDAGGDLHGPFALHAGGSVTHAAGSVDVALDRLEGRYLDRRLSLAGPAKVHVAAGRVSLERLALVLGDGRVDVDGEVGGERVNARAQLTAVPLDLLDLVAPALRMDGRVSGRLSIAGPLTAPAGDVELRVDELRERATVASELPPLGGRVQGRWRDGRLRAEGALGGFSADDLVLHADLPLAVSADGRGLVMADSEPIRGSAAWRGDVGQLWDLLVSGNDRLTGEGSLSLELAGSMRAPRLEGLLALHGGTYENLVTGTELRDLRVTLAGDDDRLVLREASANDGRGGTLSARGAIELSAARDFPVSLDFDIRKAALVNRDDLAVRASGRLGLGGTLAESTLEGTVEVEEAEARLVNRLPPQVVTLEVHEVGGDVSGGDVQTARRAGAAVMHLNVAVSAPARVFVRGLGLDSEWAGEIDVDGTLEAPSLRGVMYPVRGRYIFAGKVFSLGDGTLRFTGGPDLDPVLDLSADYRADDVTAIITVSGRASSPKVALTSRPPMPESEIASRVLFGRGSGQLSPAQTLQLAAAVASLSGAGGDGILESLRRNLGVDAINVGERSTGEGETAVSVGKYIGQGVYLELEQGAKAGTTGASVEIEVTPNVRLESGIDQRGQNKVGVKWKWDY